MLNTYENGILAITREDGAKLTYPYNPETQKAFNSEEDAIAYAYSRPMYFTLPLTLDELKHAKISNIILDPLAAVTVDGITYNGGDSSASAISGAVTLAQALGETEVKLWDINNNISNYTFEEAMNIASQIARAYRDTQFAKYELIASINARTTIEELEAIEIL